MTLSVRKKVYVCVVVLCVFGAYGLFVNSTSNQFEQGQAPASDVLIRVEDSPSADADATLVGVAAVDNSSHQQVSTANSVSIPSFEFLDIDLTSLFLSGSISYGARHQVITRYGEFIRDLALSPQGKQEVRSLLTQVFAYNSTLVRLWQSGQISEQQYRDYQLNPSQELGSLLDDSAIAAFDEWTEFKNNEFREQQARSRVKIEEYNRQNIAGLSESNQELLLDALVAANGGRSSRFFYDVDVLEQARNQLLSSFDADQLEVLNIFIESEILRQERLASARQRDNTSDLYSSNSLLKARVNINSQYGEFIRDLNLSPLEKQEVRALLVEVDIHNANYIEDMRRSNFQSDLVQSNFRQKAPELAKLGLDGLDEAFLEFEEQRVQRLYETSRIQQQQNVDRNLQRISGLSEANKKVFIDRLAQTEPFPLGGINYSPDTVKTVRDSLIGEIDADQMEIVNIYLAESEAFKISVDERTKARNAK